MNNRIEEGATEERIREVIKSVLGIKDADFSDTLSPQNCLTWDSMQHMILIVALEGEFNIRFSVTEMAEMINVALIKDAIKKRLKQG